MRLLQRVHVARSMQGRWYVPLTTVLTLID